MWNEAFVSSWRLSEIVRKTRKTLGQIQADILSANKSEILALE
jgi:hypothetical protein